jgi:hypothetical protein
MIRQDLVSALLTATDVGSVNRARIDLQRFGTPEEVRTAFEHSSVLPEHVATWMSRLHDYCFWEKPHAEPFERSEVDPEWTQFCGHGPTATKELVIGLAGSSGNVNHASASILQQLDAGAHDLLIVRDLRQRSYTEGAAGTRSFDELVERLRETAARYRSCIIIGSSMGGGPALEVGVRLGARRAISLAGGPKDGLTGLRTHTGAPPELWCLYGADNPHDAARASRLHEIHPQARLVALPGVRDHNVTRAAFWGGTFRPLFQLMLADRVDAERFVPARAEDPTVLRLEPTCTPPAWAVEQQPRRFGRAAARRAYGRLRSRARVRRSTR